MDGLTGFRLWAVMVVVATLGGHVIYWGFGTWLYRRYYVKRRDRAAEWKIQSRWVPDKLHRWGIRVAAVNMTIGGVLSGTFAYFYMTRGFSALYLDVDEYGWTYTLVSTVVLYILVEAAAYYTHRWLHVRTMFKRYHQWHHRVVAPTPYVAVTMPPVEFTLLQLTAFLPVLVLPVHAVSFIVVLVYNLLFNLMDHSGIIIEHWLPWHSSSRFHDDHHLHFHCNFGQSLDWFDRFHGTHRRQGRRYGKDVFGGQGEASSPGEQPGAYVEY